MPDPRQILAGSTRNSAAGARLIGRSDGTANITVTVILSGKNKIAPFDVHQHALLRPSERPVTDHASYEDKYGASDAAISAVESLAARFGLNVIAIDRRRRIVKLSGSVTNMEQAFGTVLHDYALGKHIYRGRTGPLQVPTEMLAHIEAVLGLDNRPVAKPRLRPRDVQASFYPQQIAALYNFPPGDGTGQTVALIELGGNYGTQDLQAYFAAAGLTQSPNVQSVSVTAGVPVPYGQDTDSDGEVMLDIEVVGAMAPGASIIVYFTENSDQGFYDAVSQAVHDPATTAVSISWGSPEKDWSAQTMDAWNSLGQSATLLNVPIFVAAGDHGCTDEQPTDQGYDGQDHADFPGTCANGVVSCGGTNLQAQNNTIASETTWNDGDGWSTGGGVSTHFQIPAWQSGINANGSTALLMRGIPDVAGVADPNTGINVLVNGSVGVSGGTSAVAPQWAALTAILSQQLGSKAGFFLPLLYANSSAAATNDIVAGNNTVFGVTGFSAKPGWDACTGLGSPDGRNLLALLARANVAVAPSPPPTPAPVPVTPPSTIGAGSGFQQVRPGSQFDPRAAISYGRFVQAAYSMYDADPHNLTPSPSPDFPPGYQLVAWIQMQDFILASTGPVFYGLIAQNMVNANQFVLAIRGTSNGVEWWDDANAAFKTPFKGGGSVGKGFARIYDTLEVVERPTSAAGAAVAQSLRALGGFSQQVSSLLKRHSIAARATGFASTASVDIAGHSLGAALATLYTLDNARTDQIQNPVLCTFASPFVGDSTFAAAFNALNLTSWRIVNSPDIVPKLPPEILGFTHVDAVQTYSSSGKVKPTLSCWHSLATYLSLIDSSLQPDAGCRLAPAAPEVVGADGTKALSVPAGPVTLNITVNVGTTC